MRMDRRAAGTLTLGQAYERASDAFLVRHPEAGKKQTLNAQSITAVPEAGTGNSLGLLTCVLFSTLGNSYTPGKVMRRF